MPAGSVLAPRFDLRPVLEAAVSNAAARDEVSWAQRLCGASASLVLGALRLGFQVAGHDDDFELTDWRNYVHGTAEPTSVGFSRELASTHPRSVVQRMFYPRAPALTMSDSFFRDPATRSTAAAFGMVDLLGVVAHPAPGRVIVLCFELARAHTLTAAEQRTFGLLRLFMEAGAAAIHVETFEAELSADAHLLAGDVAGHALWEALTSGRSHVRPAGLGPEKYYVVVENRPLERPLRRLSSDEMLVLELSARGLSGKQQSAELGRSSSTVSRLLASASAKLGFIRTSDAVRFVGGLLHRSTAPHKDVPLTSSERDVLTLVRQGLSNREIAARRHRSERTVANQLAALLRKTGAPSRRALLPLQP